MKKTKITEHQIISTLKQQETGMKVSDICREHGISDATFFLLESPIQWYGCIAAKILKELEEE